LVVVAILIALSLKISLRYVQVIGHTVREKLIIHSITNTIRAYKDISKTANKAIKKLKNARARYPVMNDGRRFFFINGILGNPLVQSTAPTATVRYGPIELFPPYVNIAVE